MPEQTKMITDEEMAALPDDNEMAFVVYEQRLREKTRDQTFESKGTVLERDYANHILAFINVCNLDIRVRGEPPRGDDEFWDWYNDFVQVIDYYTVEFRLAHARLGGSGTATTIYFSPDYKAEIHNLLGKIKKIVNSTDLPNDKKDAIYDKIAALQSEVDRSKTRMDALFSRWLDFMNAIGETAEKLEPLSKSIGRLARTFGRAKADHDRGKLPPPPELEKLPKPEDGNVTGSDLDDDIPF